MMVSGVRLVKICTERSEGKQQEGPSEINGRIPWEIFRQQNNKPVRNISNIHIHYSLYPIP